MQFFYSGYCRYRARRMLELEKFGICLISPADRALYAHRNGERCMIRKLPSGKYRLYSRKVDPSTGRRRNLGTFDTREAVEKHERAVQFFKRRGH